MVISTETWRLKGLKGLRAELTFLNKESEEKTKEPFYYKAFFE